MGEDGKGWGRGAGFNQGGARQGFTEQGTLGRKEGSMGSGYECHGKRMEGSGNSACKGPEEVSPAVRRKPAVVGNIHRFAHSTGFLGDCHTALNVLLGCGGETGQTVHVF